MSSVVLAHFHLPLHDIYQYACIYRIEHIYLQHFLSIKEPSPGLCHVNIIESVYLIILYSQGIAYVFMQSLSCCYTPLQETKFKED